jgi:hypothetical protein
MYNTLSIHTRQGPALMDKRLVVAIDGWEADSAYPSGHYVRTLGEIGKVETETVRTGCGRMGHAAGRALGGLLHAQAPRRRCLLTCRHLPPITPPATHTHPHSTPPSGGAAA